VARYEQQNHELASTVQQSQAQADELQLSLTKARTKNEELSRIKREIETVLVEQENQVVKYEEQLKQLTTDRDNQVDSANRRETEAQRMISSLTEDCHSQQKKVIVLEGLVQQLRDQLEEEKCQAVSRDDSSRSGIRDRDALIAKLKELVRKNQATADRLKEEVRQMNEEAKDKNLTIARLRGSCDELNARCNELEAALCRTSLDGSGALPEFTTHLSSRQFGTRQASGKAKSVGSEMSIELIRHAQDDDDESVDARRQHHISATQVSASSHVSDQSVYISGTANPSAGQNEIPLTRSTANLDTLADRDGLVTGQSEFSAVTRQQLLRQVGFCV